MKEGEHFDQNFFTANSIYVKQNIIYIYRTEIKFYSYSHTHAVTHSDPEVNSLKWMQLTDGQRQLFVSLNTN